MRGSAIVTEDPLADCGLEYREFETLSGWTGQAVEKATGRVVFQAEGQRPVDAQKSVYEHVAANQYREHLRSQGHNVP